jgi:hypothetical protein
MVGDAEQLKPFGCGLFEILIDRRKRMCAGDRVGVGIGQMAHHISSGKSKSVSMRCGNLLTRAMPLPRSDVRNFEPQGPAATTVVDE